MPQQQIIQKAVHIANVINCKVFCEESASVQFEKYSNELRNEVTGMYVAELLEDKQTGLLVDWINS